MSRIKILVSLAAFGLCLSLFAARPASAHESGYNHWDGNVYHDYYYGGHVDRYYYPSYGGTRDVDRVYRYPRYSSRYGDHCDDGYRNRYGRGYFGGYPYRRSYNSYRYDYRPWWR